MSIELAFYIWLVVGAVAWVWAILWMREITISGLFALVACLLLGPFALIIVALHAGDSTTLIRW